MKNKYQINYDDVRMFTKESSVMIMSYCVSLSKGESLITITGEKGLISSPYTEWKLKPNGDNTFSAYKIN
ncbi:MAG: hypothetical protein A2W05_09785 [Candidatus Schekmanbacteria bacterium RBG_16_38_10]|uniref:Uncharacterized protein n=1 Tax=Candidatus Schekmanbacteria bacterium RBG_16_38_10 TaxID=1817879 RepID=A0A1F7S0H3_9BACT|nr:MAG: hypothetical protein A2W05_09785 [Candidatus Schekmanbacteria bacterium RBG_16_38_10]